MTFEEMKFTFKDIEKAARDAHIKSTPEEIQHMCDELNVRLESILKLQEVNTEGIEPLINPLEPKYVLGLRKDTVSDGNLQEELMVRCPKSKKDYYLVPPVMDNL